MIPFLILQTKSRQETTQAGLIRADDSAIHKDIETSYSAPIIYLHSPKDRTAEIVALDKFVHA
jgi:hypothetical protein